MGTLVHTNPLNALRILFGITDQFDDPQVKHWLRLAVSTSMDYHCVLVDFNFKYRKSHHLFSRHAFATPPTGVEGNILGAGRDGMDTPSYFQPNQHARRYGRDNWGSYSPATQGPVSIINGDILT